MSNVTSYTHAKLSFHICRNVVRLIQSDFKLYILRFRRKVATAQ